MSTDTELKAKEIVDKYWGIDSCDEHPDGGYAICRHQAKALAIIHVQGIIDELCNLCKPEYTSFFHGEMGNGITMDGYELKNYWQQVKTEIEKL